MPSTRSRSRQSSSQSRSQSQSQSQPSSFEAPPPKPKRNEETFESLSTAVLPLAYTITLASTNHDLPEERKVEEYVRGQEYLSDGRRRVGEREGDAGDLRRVKKRRLVVRLDEDDRKELEKDVLWYTAKLRYACSCDLEQLPRAFTLRRTPPASEDLPSMTHELEPSEIVNMRDDILPWHTGTDEYIDLELELDHLKDFEHGWRDYTGALWRETHGSGPFCDALDDSDDNEDLEIPEAAPNHPIILETPAGRWLRKGKYKAIDFENGTAIPDGGIPETPMNVHDLVLETPYPAPRKVEEITPSGPELQKKIEWEHESKRRKKLWRGLIGKDPAYGQFWDFLSRPHSYVNLGARANQVKPPDYNLFRNYHTASHPFHPDLHHYARQNAGGRVYWLIPIHGPVVVPRLNDDVLTSPLATKEDKIPLPSSATFSTETADASKTKNRAGRPAHIHWNASLLNHFIQSFLLPLRQSRMYGLSIVFSGPKPDPFIALIPPAQLVQHSHLDTPRLNTEGDLPAKEVSNGKSTHEDTDARSRPIRVEAGDHMRIYCDSREALSLRTWLHGVHVDRGVASQPGEGAKGRRLFDKVRMCLIGGRGEVLIVA